MKRSQIHLPKIDVRSIDFQTFLELMVGGLSIALLMRWMEM